MLQTGVKEFIEKNIDSIENDPIWIYLLRWNGWRGGLEELTELLTSFENAGISITTQGATDDELFRLLKHIFEDQPTGHNLVVKRSKTSLRIVDYLALGRIYPDEIQERVDFEKKFFKIASDKIQRVCTLLGLKTSVSDIAVEQRGKSPKDYKVSATIRCSVIIQL